MYHPPDIRLVNAHPKSDGGTYHFDPVVDEVVLCFVPLAGRQSGMVDAATDAVFCNICATVSVLLLPCSK